MRATDILMAEHRVIEQVLHCLEKVALRCEAGAKLDKESALQVLDFLGHFADHCHHGKEEGHLFPMLEARGLPRAGGPTGVMLHEHEQGRQHVRAMADAVEADAAGDLASRNAFVQHATAYVRLLREHIQKEDQRLFPMAANLLSEADRQALLSAFEAVERDDMGEGTHEKYLHLADDLADRLGVPHARAEVAVHHCCHGNH